MHTLPTLRHLYIAIALLCAATRPVHAQSVSGTLKLPSDAVQVNATLHANDQRDPLWNGMLIGAGTSAAASFIVYPHARHKAQTAAVASAFGAAWGAWIDSQIKGKRLVCGVGPKRVQLGLRF